MEVTRRTDLSPDSLWAVMSDVREWPQWLDTMNDLDPLEPERPEEVGAAYRLDQTGFPTATWTITEWLPGRGFTWVSNAPGVESTIRRTLEPDGDGTLIRLAVTWTGPMSRPVSGVIEGTVQNYFEHEALELETRARDLGDQREQDGAPEPR